MLLSKDFIKNNTVRPLDGEKKKKKRPHRKQTALKFTSSIPSSFSLLIHLSEHTSLRLYIHF